MLEDLAIRYISAGEDAIRLISTGVVIVGAIIAGVTWRGKGTIRRAPYFAYSWMIFLAVAATQVVWLGSLPAMEGGYVWVFMAVDVMVFLAAGYAFCIIAKARSRDVSGSARFTAFAFIPFANLWLLFAPSKSEVDANRIPTPPLVSGGLGVLTGIAAAAASIAVQLGVTVQLEKMMADDASLAAGTAIAVRQMGVEALIQQLSQEVTEPMQVDEITVLDRMQAEGTTLRYIYLVDTDLTALTDDFVAGVEEHFCTYGAFVPIIREGGRIAATYYNAAKVAMGEAVSDATTCGF